MNESAEQPERATPTWFKDLIALAKEMEHCGPCWETDGQERFPDDCQKCYLEQILGEIPVAEPLGGEPERPINSQRLTNDNRLTLDAVMRELSLRGISYCDDLGEEPWECAAEPEPQYFATLREAIDFRDSLKPNPEGVGEPERERLIALTFWNGQRWRFCPQCQSRAFDFAEAYAAARSAQPAQAGNLWLCYHALKASEWRAGFCAYCMNLEADGHDKDCMIGNALKWTGESLLTPKEDQ